MIKTTIYGMRLASILLALYWIAIFAGTHMRPPQLPHINHIDKIFHAGAFAGLAFLMAWAIPTKMRQPRWNVLIAALVCVGYAAFDEFSQAPVGRTPDILDWAADCAGTLLGLTSYLITRSWLWRRQRFSPIPQPKPQLDQPA